ncbi:MAG: extracellular solute-binding protein [Defluviitaleaceae bacterium]|nr:extracellular solute-binding protein [Defluviitaleaceae bacterium]
MKRKVIIAALVTVILLLLAACGNGGSDSGNQDATAEPVELEFFLIKVQALGVHEEMQQLFNEEHPNVTVRFVATPDAETALFARVAAGDIPDMMNTFPAELIYRNMMDDGLFVDLTGHSMLGNIQPAVLDLAEHNGKLYALPIALSSYGVFYNQDLFAEHGLSVPTTYADFLAVAEAFVDTDVTPIVFFDRSAGPVGQMIERVMSILHNDSDTLFRDIVEGREDIWARNEVRALAETMLEIRQFGQLDQMGTDIDQAMAEFVSGRAAMMIGGTWHTTFFLDADPPFDYSMFQFPNPLGPQGLPINLDTSHSIYVNASCVDSALAKLEFLSRTEIAQMYADVEGSPNIVNGVQFNTVPLREINDDMNNPSMNVFITPVNFWPPGMRARWQEYAQLLFMDRDVDGFIRNTEGMLHEFYD